MGSRHRTVVWTESAYAALDDVISFIAQDSRERAIKVLTRALDTAASLQTLAERGRIVPELRQSDLRELFVYRYRLMYRVSADLRSGANECASFDRAGPVGERRNRDEHWPTGRDLSSRGGSFNYCLSTWELVTGHRQLRTGPVLPFLSQQLPLPCNISLAQE